LCGLAAVFLLGACASSGGTTPQEKRQAVLSMKNDVLAELYRVHPKAKAKVEKAPGYAVFSNTNVNVIFASFGGGYGVVSEKNGRPVYMKMGEAGLGLGLGVKDFRAVFVFHDRATLKKFVDSGWEFGGHADAAAKAGDKGGAVGGEVLLDGISVYQLTKNGLALQATVKGTKYWKDDELN
jgi:lipid-binding SYLF domain-containing protein